MKPTKNQLIYLYVKKKLEIEKICKKLNISVGSFYYYLKKFHISLRGNKGIKKPPLTEEHKKKISKTKIKTGVHKGKNNWNWGWKEEKNQNWKGGKEIRNGYVYLTVLDHPYKDKKGHVAEHRLVMEKIIGRYLKPSEEVHHINKIRTDNKPENLILFANKAEHVRFHKTGHRQEEAYHPIGMGLENFLYYHENKMQLIRTIGNVISGIGGALAILRIFGII